MAQNKSVKVHTRLQFDFVLGPIIVCGSVDKKGCLETNRTRYLYIVRTHIVICQCRYNRLALTRSTCI